MSDHPHEPVHPSAQDPYSFDPAQQHLGAAGDPYAAHEGAEGLADDDGSWFLQDDAIDETHAQTEQFEAVGALPDELGAAPVAGDWDEAAHADEWMDDGMGGEGAVSPLNDEDLVGASYVEPESTRGALARAVIPGAIALVMTFGAVGAIAVLKNGSLDSLLGTGDSPDVDSRRTAPRRGPEGPGADLASIDGSGAVGTRIGQTRDGSTFEAGTSRPTVESPREPGELAPGETFTPPSMDFAGAVSDDAGSAMETAEAEIDDAAGSFEAAGAAAAEEAEDARAAEAAEATEIVEIASAAAPESVDEFKETPAPESIAVSEEALAPESLGGAAASAAAEPFARGSLLDPAGPLGVAVPFEFEPSAFADESFVALEDAPEGVFGADEGAQPTRIPEAPASENPLAAAFAAVGHEPDEPAFPLELVFATAGATESTPDSTSTDESGPTLADASGDAPPAAAPEPGPVDPLGPAADETFAYVPFGYAEESGGGLEVSVSERELPVEPMGPEVTAPETSETDDAPAESGDGPAAVPTEAEAEARLDEVFGPANPGAPLDPIAPEAPPGPTAPAVAEADEPERSTVFPLPADSGGDAPPTDVAEAPSPGDAPETDAPAVKGPDAKGPDADGPKVAGAEDPKPETGGAGPDGPATTNDDAGGSKPKPDAGERVAEAEPEVRPNIADQVEQKRRGGVLNRVDDGSVWRHRTVPKTKIRGDQFVLTPMVGNVRVVFAGGETIDGRLHGVGDGQVVLFTKIGRVKLESKRVDRIDRIGGSRELPDPTKQASRKGLDHVRVRTKGGVFDGHLVSRDGDKVTLLMGEGVRVTLDAIEVTPFKGVRAGSRIRRQSGGDGGDDGE